MNNRFTIMNQAPLMGALRVLVCQGKLSSVLQKYHPGGSDSAHCGNLLFARKAFLVKPYSLRNVYTVPFKTANTKSVRCL